VPAIGETTGYKAVWPRDFYQVASALLALGDRETPVAALDYLPTVQVLGGTPQNRGAEGWFLQKTHVDGTPEWTGVQLDQTAMPIMLADKLHRAGLLGQARLRALYDLSLRPAAAFLIAGGEIAFGADRAMIRPPATQMERWEEQPGFSPSTMAAIVAGLLAAADLARALGETGDGARYAAAARAVSGTIEARTFTTRGPYGDGRYYVRIAPKGRPDAKDRLKPRNGRPGLSQQAYLDGGFLELVRYGLRRPNDSAILASLAKLDDQSLPHRMRVRYDFSFEGRTGAAPGWRRYSDDGYGEDERTGTGFGPVGASGRDSRGQRGRVWPIFTGERGHYEIARALEGPKEGRAAALAAARETYAWAMELFANPGLMIPEQVYDGVGAAGKRPRPGQGAGAATPLAWSHAEYVKLLRSLADEAVWDRLDPNALEPLTVPCDTAAEASGGTGREGR
jgi:glucoamylase